MVFYPTHSLKFLLLIFYFSATTFVYGQLTCAGGCSGSQNGSGDWNCLVGTYANYGANCATGSCDNLPDLRVNQYVRLYLTPGTYTWDIGTNSDGNCGSTVKLELKSEFTGEYLYTNSSCSAGTVNIADGSGSGIRMTYVVYSCNEGWYNLGLTLNGGTNTSCPNTCSGYANSITESFTCSGSAPVVTSQPSSSAKCYNGTITFTASATGASSYQWQYSTNNSSWSNISNGTPTNASYTGSTTNSLSVSGAFNTGTHYYRLRFTSAGGCVSYSNSAQMTFTTPSSSGLSSGEWLWTGYTSTTWEDVSNWLTWNGTAFTVPTTLPLSTSNVRVRPNSTCIMNQPTVTSTQTNSSSADAADCNQLTIDASATLTMLAAVNVHFHIFGNYVNNGTFVPNNGRVKFVATGNQSITYPINQTIQFYEMNIGVNSVTTIQNHTEVTNALRLNGVVITGSTYRLWLKTTATDGASTGLVTGANGGHIYGNFRRTIQSNSSTYSFPVGVSNTLTTGRRLLQLENNFLTGTAYLDCSVSNTFKGSGNNTDAWLSTTNAVLSGELITFIHPEAQWRLIPDSQPGSGSYGILAYLQNYSSISSSQDNKFTILKRNDNSSSFADFNVFGATTTIPSSFSPGRTYASGYSKRSGFTSFSEFVIGSSSNGVPLGNESETISFHCEKDVLQLAWKQHPTSTFTSYLVEGSIDGQSYSALEISHRNGDTYSLNISSSLGFQYLKLIGIDENGIYHELAIIPVNCASSEPFHVSNPVGEELYIQLKEKVIGDLYMYATDGKLLLQETVNSESGTLLQIPMHSFTAGMYVLHLETSAWSATKQIQHY